MDRDLKTRFEQHPYGALAIALGAGYVLGGGFFTPLTERIAKLAVRVGIRAALVPLLRSQISELMAPAAKSEAAPPSPPAGRSEAANENAA